MNIKTICKLSFKREEEFNSYIDYEIYPMASIFANSKEEALISYLDKMTNPHIEIQECNIMEMTLVHKVLCFYRVKGRNITLNSDVVEDYLIIDVPFIDS